MYFQRLSGLGTPFASFSMGKSMSEAAGLKKKDMEELDELQDLIGDLLTSSNDVLNTYDWSMTQWINRNRRT